MHNDTPPERVLRETADIETSSDDYAARFQGPTGQWFLQVQERIVVSMLKRDTSLSVLDVGGGHGQLAVPLCREGFSMTVLGSDESCKSRIDDLVKAEQCVFKVGNVVELPFDDGSFDVVLCFRLLPHCNAWPQLIGELCRVAKRSVIVDYPTSQSLNRIAPMLFTAKQKIEKNTRQWRLFRHKEIRAAFGDHGFSLEQKKAQFFLPMVLHRALRFRGLSVALEGACRLLGLTWLSGSPVIVKMSK